MINIQRHGQFAKAGFHRFFKKVNYFFGDIINDFSTYTYGHIPIPGFLEKKVHGKVFLQGLLPQVVPPQGKH
jgi:hypothetical protein